MNQLWDTSNLGMAGKGRIVDVERMSDGTRSIPEPRDTIYDIKT